ncbi:MAG: hypothetical protein F6J86_38575 [Symploca sp. SIO1B1]|nr:hypothetical protein [Symploca sp. SIO1B1]
MNDLIIQKALRHEVSLGSVKTQAVMLIYPDCLRNQAAKQYIEITRSKVAKTIAIS